MTAERLWTGLRLWTGTSAPVSGPHHAVAAKGGRIAWLGPEGDAPAAREVIDCGGRLATPGLVDCHTHLVYAGNRVEEWRLRQEGASYEALARAGGGIAATVKAVRAADDDQLMRQSLPRLEALMAHGVTTVEIKSGYGLDAANEAKMLRVARRLGETRPIRVSTSFLGAHAVPAGMAADAYVDDVCERQLPAIVREGLADALDAYCEAIAFSPAHVARLFTAAKAHGIPVKLHAEQLSNSGGALLAARHGALSCDHLEHVDEAGAHAMAAAGTVAVLLPGAYYFLKEKTPPPVALLRRHGVAMAVASDCNPGSSPLASPLLAMNMAVTLFGLTPEEALLGMTRHGARALGLADECGTLEVGTSCDLAIWEVETPAELSYHLGLNPLFQRVWRGETTPTPGDKR
ncbi:MAG: imidazolonepropionase [Pseudomonadota bacterium]